MTTTVASFPLPAQRRRNLIFPLQLLLMLFSLLLLLLLLLTCVFALQCKVCQSLKLQPFVVFATISRTRLFVASLGQTTAKSTKMSPKTNHFVYSQTIACRRRRLRFLTLLQQLLYYLSADVLLRGQHFNILVDAIGSLPFTASHALSRNFVTKINFISLGFWFLRVVFHFIECAPVYELLALKLSLCHGPTACHLDAVL